MPFYNTPKQYFRECLLSLQKLDPFEVILVDDCSTDTELVQMAKNSGFVYLRTSFQSGFDGVPFNLGVLHAEGEYICRMDSDDILLELPEAMETEFCFGNIDRVHIPDNLMLEDLLLAPRALGNAMVGRRELYMKYPMAEDGNVFGDVLFVLRLLYNGHTFTRFPRVNYIYRDCENSIQTSKSPFYHRLRHIQTVARFCQLENIPPGKAIGFLNLAMLNTRYGSKALKALKAGKKNAVSG